MNYPPKGDVLKIMIGGSTVCAQYNRSSKINQREIIAIGRLVYPYCVYLKK